MLVELDAALPRLIIRKMNNNLNLLLTNALLLGSAAVGF